VTGKATVVEGRALGRARTTIDGRLRVKAQVRRPREEWHVREIPELKLIDDHTLEVVDRRLADHEPSKHGKPFTGSRKRRLPLLSGGALRCAMCGRKFQTVGAAKPNGGYYVCSGRRRILGCRNSTRLPISMMDDAVISALENTYLSEAATERLLAFVDTAPEAERRGLEAERDRLKSETRRLAEALGTGEQPAAVIEVIRERQQSCGGSARLKERPPDLPDRETLRKALRSQAGDWRAALRVNPVVARALMPIVLQDQGDLPDYVANPTPPTAAEVAAAGEGLVKRTVQARTEALIEGVLPRTSTRACGAPGGSSEAHRAPAGGRRRVP